MDHAYAYLHGFGSSSQSFKGGMFARQFEERGHTLLLPDLNVPSFERLSYTGSLTAIDALDEREGQGRIWCFIASSLGGYLGARWAQLNPGRVHRLLLLCPAFDMLARWPSLMGEEAFAMWERNKAFFFVGPDGEPTPVSFEFVTDANTHPAFPEFECQTLIVHGTEDETVPFEQSRTYAETRDHVRLAAVPDGHDLVMSVDNILDHAVEFFDLSTA